MMKMQLSFKFNMTSMLFMLLPLTAVLFIQESGAYRPDFIAVYVLIQGFIFFVWNKLMLIRIKKSNRITKMLDMNYDEQIEHIKDMEPLNNGEERLVKLIRSMQFAVNVESQMEKDSALLEEEINRLKAKTTELNIEKQLNMTAYDLQDTINRNLSGFSDQLLVRLDSHGSVLDVNELFVSRLGYSKKECIGKSFSDFYQGGNEGNGPKITSLFQASEEPLFLRIWYKNHGGGAFEYVSFKTIELSDGSYLCVGKSIGDEITLQSRIIRKKKELDYINQINSALISNRSVDELLENIVKRLENLFNLTLGCIYTLNDQKAWELVTYTSKNLSREEFLEFEIEQNFDENWLNTLEVKIEKQDSELGDFVKYMAFAPLEVEGKVIAIMCIGLVQDIKVNDYNILRMFNNQASIVVQRAIIYEKLRRQYFNTIEALVSVIEAKDKYTEGHSRRVSRFAVEIAKKMGYSNEEIENVEISGLLHDVGKIGIDQDILIKRGKLSDEEYEIMKLHPEKGIQILDTIHLRDDIREGILYHHARFDLRGYPTHTLEELPLFAAIIGAADAFDAITSARSYSHARSIDDALKELIQYKGTQFYPEIIEIIERLVKENREIIQTIIDDQQGERNVISGTLQTVAAT
ncbi:MAG: HD domain-containing protein [Clostridia bacterium]|nr:HD domain-containing protein [Clostridia bacterium]